MEKRIETAELSALELETVTGGQTVDMMGDTWECNGDGHPVHKSNGYSIVNWIKSWWK